MHDGKLIKLSKQEIERVVRDLEVVNETMKNYEHDLRTFYGLLPDDEQVKNVRSEINEREVLATRLRHYLK